MLQESNFYEKSLVGKFARNLRRKRILRRKTVFYSDVEVILRCFSPRVKARKERVKMLSQSNSMKVNHYCNVIDVKS